MVLSTFYTLKGIELLVMTTGDRSETWVFTPTPAVNYIPLPDMAHWYKQDDDRPA
jgi:hypothetical protein